MRWGALVVMAGLALTVALMPSPAAPTPDAEPGTAMPPVSICPIVEAGVRHTTISVLSSVNGRGRISSFAAGAETGSVEFRTGPTGSVTVPASDLSAVGVSGGLIELPSDTTVAGVTLTGRRSLAAESCADRPTSQAYVMGGSTASGASFQIQLLNPYAGEAIVDLIVTTDAGVESNARFDAVVVPALSSITLDMTEIIPGRETINASLETTRGSVLATARQSRGGETAMWRAVEPGLDWWIPVPEGGGAKRLLIGNATNGDVDYQVDLYGPEGYVEGFATGVIDPRGRVAMSLTDISTEPIGIRVITAAPVVAGLSIDSSAGLAMTTGASVDAITWLLPGASSPVGGSGSVVVLNTGIEEVTVGVRSLREQSLIRNLDLAPESLLVVDLVAADGYRIDASGPVVALWTSQVESATTAAIGFPIQDG